MGWPDIHSSPRGTSRVKGLMTNLRDLFSTFSIPEVLSSDRRPEFMAGETKKFPKVYNVEQRLLSVGNPHSNQHAEAGVKSMKLLISENTNAVGKLNNE